MNHPGEGDKSLSRQKGTEMEASEHAQARHAARRPPLRHVDPALIIDELAPGQRESGYARLNLMVNAVFPRLVAGEPHSRRGR
jgi:hypothetical protein